MPGLARVLKAIVTASSLTATSVTISWSPQPAQFHLPVVEYTVSLTRVTGSGQALCTQVMDSRPYAAVTTTNTLITFFGLEEFSNYTITVTTIHSMCLVAIYVNYVVEVSSSTEVYIAVNYHSLQSFIPWETQCFGPVCRPRNVKCYYK